MVSVNILYNTTTGRILSAGPAVITPIPAGHSIVSRTVDSVSDIFDKKIDPVGLPLVLKDFLRLDSPVELETAIVSTAVFTKHDGATEEAKDDPSDNETVLISARQPDFSYSTQKRRAFFDFLQTQLFQGAGQVKVATGLANGTELFVAFNDTLSPVFKQLTYK